MDTAHQRAEPIGIDFIHSGIGDIETGTIDKGEIRPCGNQHDEHEDRECAEMIKGIEIRFGETVDETFKASPDSFEEAEGLALSIRVTSHVVGSRFQVYFGDRVVPNKETTTYKSILSYWSRSQ